MQKLQQNNKILCTLVNLLDFEVIVVVLCVYFMVGLIFLYTNCCAFLSISTVLDCTLWSGDLSV